MFIKFFCLEIHLCCELQTAALQFICRDSDDSAREELFSGVRTQANIRENPAGRELFITATTTAASCESASTRYLKDVIQYFQDCQDAGSYEQAHLSTDVTWKTSASEHEKRLPARQKHHQQ